jgi:hypothetical protein
VAAHMGANSFFFEGEGDARLIAFVLHLGNGTVRRVTTEPLIKRITRQKLGKSSRSPKLASDTERARVRALSKLPGLDSNQQPSG